MTVLTASSGKVMRLAPGLYRVQTGTGSRMVRIHGVQTVKDRTLSFGCRGVANHDLAAQTLREDGFALPVLLGAYEVHKQLKQGYARATDGCMVAPDGFCQHHHPSNAILWGMV